MIGMIVTVAAGNALDGRPPWHTWLTSLALILSFVPLVGLFDYVGTQLRT